MLDRKVTLTLIGALILLLFLSVEFRARNTIALLLIILAGVVLFGRWSKDEGEREVVPKPVRPTRRKPPEMDAAAQRKLQEIQSLTAEEARKRGEAVLTDESRWHLLPFEGEANEIIQRLSPTLRDLFTRYAAVEAVGGAANLGSDGVRKFDWPTDQFLGFGQGEEEAKPVLLQIGNDFDNRPLVVKQLEETVHVVHGSRSAPEKAWWATYPTVYHWLLTAEFFFRT